MNGIGLLITVGFCTIIWWGTSSYYKALITKLNRAWKRAYDEMEKGTR